MFTANSYSGTKFNTLFDIRCSDNNASLNGFAFNIIGGTDISNKLKYLETKSGDNITKIEIFMQCTRYEHPKFYLVTSSTSNGLAINTTDWGDTPDKASNTAMTGSAANTIKAAALTASAGSATKPIYFNNGIPTECNYALEKAVPSDAVFTDTKNTAGSLDDAGKLYLVGAKSQSESDKTYSNSKVYMTDGTLTVNALSTSTMVLPEGSLYLEFVNGNNKASAANFSYQTIGGASLDITGHLVLNEGGGHPNQPENKTGLPSVSYADYFNTGITAYGISASTSLPAAYKLSFPAKSGTFLLDSDLVAEDMVEATFSPADNSYNSVPSGSSADSLNSILTVPSNIINGSLNAGDRVAIRAFIGSLGDSNTPIHISSGGHLCKCTKYAGGTNITLNGNGKGGNDASFYAPTATGTDGYHLF